MVITCQNTKWCQWTYREQWITVGNMNERLGIHVVQRLLAQPGWDQHQRQALKDNLNELLKQAETFRLNTKAKTCPTVSAKINAPDTTTTEQDHTQPRTRNRKRKNH